MQHVAALAECAEIARSIVAGVVVEVRCRQKDLGEEQAFIVSDRLGEARERPAAATSPEFGAGIPPAAVAEVPHHMSVWAAALLASPLCALETDRGRDLRPVDRVKPAMLRSDGHAGSLNPEREISNSASPRSGVDFLRSAPQRSPSVKV